jgi:MoxR-like ATPase
MQSINEISTRMAALRQQLDRVILGQDRVKTLAVTCLLAGGHMLLEGVPGTGKTLLSLALARLLGCRFRRIQFTPDLMPADLLGANVFNQKTQEFVFRAGPVFTDILLADEINRTPPRTQAALLESMQENAVTVDGTRYEVSPVFSVFATQNPVEFEGTYPLPEAQRDRFLFKINIDFPEAADEQRMLQAYASGQRLHDETVASLQPVLSGQELLEARRTISSKVRVEQNTFATSRSWSRARARTTRCRSAPARASLTLLEDRAQPRSPVATVTPDDVKSLVPSVSPPRDAESEAEMEGGAGGLAFANFDRSRYR